VRKAENNPKRYVVKKREKHHRFMEEKTPNNALAPDFAEGAG